MVQLHDLLYNKRHRTSEASEVGLIVRQNVQVYHDMDGKMLHKMQFAHKYPARCVLWPDSKCKTVCKCRLKMQIDGRLPLKMQIVHSFVRKMPCKMRMPRPFAPQNAFPSPTYPLATHLKMSAIVQDIAPRKGDRRPEGP